MGLFSNPKCPRCGKETTVQRDMFESYYTCTPCVNKLRKEKQEKEDLLKRVEALEKQLDKEK